MILEKETFIKFGYYSVGLSKCSHNKVIRKCDICGKVQIREFRRYKSLCILCSNKKRIVDNQKYCVDCGNNITVNAKRCLTCNGKIRQINKPCKDCGKKTSLRSTGRCLRCSNAQRRNPVLPHKCIECDNMVVVLKAKRCRSCANKLIGKSNIGRKPTHGKYNLLNNVWFRSSWEVNFAIWLNGSNIKWKYEPKGFKIKLKDKIRIYWPDFYLPEFDLWIEVKGWWRDDAKEKYDCFLKQYPKINIEIFNKDVLERIGVIK